MALAVRAFSETEDGPPIENRLTLPLNDRIITPNNHRTNKNYGSPNNGKLGGNNNLRSYRITTPYANNKMDNRFANSLRTINEYIKWKSDGFYSSDGKLTNPEINELLNLFEQRGEGRIEVMFVKSEKKAKLPRKLVSSKDRMSKVDKMDEDSLENSEIDDVIDSESDSDGDDSEKNILGVSEEQNEDNEDHNNKYIVKRFYHCNFCRGIFDRPVRLIEHMEDCHSGHQNFKFTPQFHRSCLPCNDEKQQSVEYSSGSANTPLQHIEYKDGNQLRLLKDEDHSEVSSINKQTSNRVSAFKTKYQNSVEPKKYFICEDCGVRLSRRDVLKRHMTSKHSQ